MKIKIIGLLFALCGFVIFAGTVSANTADILQPASDVTYNENLIVNGTGIFDSIKVGKQGVGGVTFFNGTIINITTDENGDGVPVTFGDDVRIDGLIWRGATPGFGDDMPVKVMDDLYIDGVLTGSNSVVVDDDLIVNNSIQMNQGYGHGGLTIESDNDIKTEGGITAIKESTFWGDLNTHGDIRQDHGDYGAVKALVFVDGTGAVSCRRAWTFDNSEVKCNKAGGGAGVYIVEFDFNVNDYHYVQVTAWDSNAKASGRGTANNNIISVYTDHRDFILYGRIDADFMVTVY